MESYVSRIRDWLPVLDFDFGLQGAVLVNVRETREKDFP